VGSCVAAPVTTDALDRSDNANAAKSQIGSEVHLFSVLCGYGERQESGNTVGGSRRLWMAPEGGVSGLIYPMTPTLPYTTST
ncbi:hypothetical protein KIPB_017296, partial [Kipferlia bialata]